jgi:uncharacterized protein YktB (UPF0637 family)
VDLGGVEARIPNSWGCDWGRDFHIPIQTRTERDIAHQATIVSASVPEIHLMIPDHLKDNVNIREEVHKMMVKKMAKELDDRVRKLIYGS